MDKMLRRSLVLVILFMGCLITAGVQAATLEVGPEGSGYPYTSIQTAIDDAGTGDTVLVHDGTYTERINFSGKAITLKSVNGSAFTIIDGSSSGSVVTFSSGEGSGSVLDGFTITNGNANSGGGIYCYLSSPTITNCTVTGNTAVVGGGIYCYASSPTITNCTITGNSAGNGGGIYCFFFSSPTITNCTITGNDASSQGGGIFCADSSPTITNCTISGNSAGANGGGIFCAASSPTITNCTISGNSAGYGGGIYCGGSSPTITNCTISGNSASSRGGGIYCNASSPTITNCTISGNSAGYGGGIYCDASSSPSITNCIIAGNSAEDGGGIFCWESSPTITNCTITGNYAALAVGGIICYYDSSPTVKNSILWGNSPHEIILNNSTVTVSYSDVDQDGYAGSNGNIRQDPLFVDAAKGDFRLQAASPCIDAATSEDAPLTDMVGNPRFDAPWVPNTGGGEYPYYDMGALELFVETVPPPEATLISPTGTIDDTTPAYTWNAVSNSTWYCLYVNDATGNKINRWYTREEAGCASGTGTCSVTPSTEVIGSSQWWVRTYNSAGYGPWSLPGMTFTAPSIPPSAAIQVSPTGTISTPTPTYTWNAVSNSTWYCLYVNDSTGNKINRWYTREEAGCASGTGTCSVTPTTEVRGAGQWWVRTYNSAGYGPWSLPGMTFTAPSPTVPPIAATQVSPTGAWSDSTPTYTWNAVSGASWYCLYVNDSTGNKVNQWFAASEAGCASGVGSCSVTPTNEVRGEGQWWVRTYNSAGYGPWSLPGMTFTAPTPSAPGAAIQILPSGTIRDTTPTYTWNAVSTATWYQLWVGDSSGNKINQWYAAADVGCADGVGTCSVTPSTMVLGSCTWYIRTYNSGGYGPWSLPGMSFTVSP